MATANEAPQKTEGAEEYVNAVVEPAASVAPERRFTIAGHDPFDAIEWSVGVLFGDDPDEE